MMGIDAVPHSLKRLPWRLWMVLSALWIGFWLVVFSSAGIRVSADSLYWMILFGPPAVLLPATGLLSWIIAGVRRNRRGRAR